MGLEGFVGFIWTLLIIQGIIIGSFSGFVAREKGRNRLAWFFNGFLFSIVGLIAICGVPSVNRNSERSEINNPNLNLLQEVSVFMASSRGRLVGVVVLSSLSFIMVAYIFLKLFSLGVLF